MKYAQAVDLSGKVAVVTGARQGLGRIFAEALASAGAEVFLMARSMEALEQAAAEIGEATGASCHSVFIDVLDEGSVASAAAQVRAGQDGWTSCSTMRRWAAGLFRYKIQAWRSGT